MAWFRLATRALTRITLRAARQVRQRGFSVASRAVRLSGATVAAYVVAGVLLDDTVPVIAALTALLVVEVTLVDILTSGVQRVVSVISGVLLAVGFSYVVGISWWSLGVLVMVSIVLGQALRLGPHLVEVPISAMLVLAVRGDEIVASDRIIETLIGATVGLAVSVIFPPRIQAVSAARAVSEFADEMAALLRQASDELVGNMGGVEAGVWLAEARRLSRRVPDVDRAVAQAEHSRRLNPRALAEQDSSEVLRGGWEALEHCSVAVRTMFRDIADGIREHTQTDRETSEAVRTAFATLLSELADAVHAYGELVEAEVAETTEPAQEAAVTAMIALREARVRVNELRLVEQPADHVTWELNDALLETVDRVLIELDVQEQTRRRNRRRALLKVRPREALRSAQKGFRAGTDQFTDQRRYPPPHA
jgi:uncharacterized membrane protein YccC